MQQIIPLTAEVAVSAVSFLVLLAIMWKFALPPVTNMLDERAAKIRDSLEAAEQTRVEAERLLEGYKQQLAEAREEATHIVEQGRKVADTMKAEIVAKANEERESMLTRARDEIEGQKKAAMAELQAQVADLSVAVAGRVIGKTLSAADHAELIDSFLAEVGSLDEN